MGITNVLMVLESCDLCGSKGELVEFQKDTMTDGNITSYRGRICEDCKDKEIERFDKENGLPSNEPF